MVLYDLHAAYLHCRGQFAFFDRKIARQNFKVTDSFEICDLLVDVSHGGLDGVGDYLRLKQIRRLATILSPQAL